MFEVSVNNASCLGSLSASADRPTSHLIFSTREEINQFQTVVADLDDLWNNGVGSLTLTELLLLFWIFVSMHILLK